METVQVFLSLAFSFRHPVLILQEKEQQFLQHLPALHYLQQGDDRILPFHTGEVTYHRGLILTAKRVC